MLRNIPRSIGILTRRQAGANVKRITPAVLPFQPVSVPQRYFSQIKMDSFDISKGKNA